MDMKLLAVGIIFITVLFNSLDSHSNFTRFPVEEDEEKIISTINLRLTDEDIESTVSCFDVNEDHIIATGTTLTNNHTSYIRVFTANDEFLYGFFFYTSGSFVLEWQGDNLGIYLIRGDYYITVNSGGEILSLEKVENTERNEDYLDNVLRSKKKTVGYTTYTLTNENPSIFDFDYSILHISDRGEEKTIVLKEYSLGAYKMIVNPIIGLLVFGIFTLIIRSIANLKQKQT